MNLGGGYNLSYNGIYVLEKSFYGNSMFWLGEMIGFNLIFIGW